MTDQDFLDIALDIQLSFVMATTAKQKERADKELMWKLENVYRKGYKDGMSQSK